MPQKRKLKLDVVMGDWIGVGFHAGMPGEYRITVGVGKDKPGAATEWRVFLDEIEAVGLLGDLQRALEQLRDAAQQEKGQK